MTNREILPIRQAIAVVKVKLRRDLREAHHRAEVCGCPSCKSETRRIAEWMNTPKEQQ